MSQLPPLSAWLPLISRKLSHHGAVGPRPGDRDMKYVISHLVTGALHHLAELLKVQLDFIEFGFIVLSIKFADINSCQVNTDQTRLSS